MLFFKLAVGETLPIHKSGINELKEIEQFPPNYDTIYMTDSK